MFVLLFLSLIFSIWIILSGQFSYFFIVSGITSSFIVLIIFYKLDFHKSAKSEKIFIFRFIFYVFWMFSEIFKSSQEIVRIIWRLNLDISPTFGYISTNIEDNYGKFIYANSISLTPGTLTIKLEGNKLIVHSLTDNGYVDLEDRRMEKKVLKLGKK